MSSKFRELPSLQKKSGNGENDRFGPGYILDRDVVLVTINYRLGPLGEFRNFFIGLLDTSPSCLSSC
jgi:hypothetical protein